MPGLCSLGARAALQEVQAGLRDGEAVFVFLNGVYVVALPDRVRELHPAVEVALWRHAHVQLNRAKTRIWNAAGEEPANIGDLRPVGGDPVWVGDWALPRDQQSLKVLGTPLGSEALCGTSSCSKKNRVTTSVDGSAVLPTPVTSARLRRFFRAFHLHLECCCCHRLGRIPRVPHGFSQTRGCHTPQYALPCSPPSPAAPVAPTCTAGLRLPPST